MRSLNSIKGRWIMTLLIGVTLSFPTNSTPLFLNILASEEIGSKGGNIMVEDPETVITVELTFPEGALREKTIITLIINGSPQPKVLDKTHINGISVIPKGILLQEKAQLSVYNPPGDVTESMLLFRVAGEQFIIPLGDQEKHLDENWIEGTFYITGKFSLGTPTAAEVSAQCKKLAAYNPARPLAYGGEENDTRIKILPDFPDAYIFNRAGGPNADLPPDAGLTFYSGADKEECMRWQKALTKVEAHLTWVQQHQWTGNREGEKSERANAENALQEAIDGYLKKASPANRCGSYIKAAAKYLDRATSLGMNILDESPIAQQFNQLVDECSFVFTVEKREWINKPKEKRQDGSTYEEKATYYKTIKCYTPWNEFLATSTQKIRGEGTMSLHSESHWVGDEKNDHAVTDGSWRAEKIEGGIQQYVDDHGEQTMLANMSIYWGKNVTSHAWGKVAGGKA